MGKYEVHGGVKRDFDLHAGPVESEGDCKQFGDRLWADVARVLEVSFAGSPGEPGDRGSHRYRFEDDAMSVSLYVDEGEPGWVFEKVPAMLTARSRSESAETRQLAEKLYAGLVATGTCFVAVFAEDGMPIDANFDIGDDW
ncbi:hypothetical protein [Streptomyces sp. JHA26]|uniref:hypothetical protein n=1 Tax=Streptomyces sp. JHA26 TaxID=1917143 RepID=UPI00098BB1B9|nr:hypothetical protein [Streptomyces sp. JHA26]